MTGETGTEKQVMSGLERVGWLGGGSYLQKNLLSDTSGSFDDTRRAPPASEYVCLRSREVCTCKVPLSPANITRDAALPLVS